MPAWARLIALLAAVRIIVGLAFYLSGYVDVSGPSPIPVWAYALLGSSFAIVGGGLIVGNKRDPRAAWLGGLLLLLAVPITERLIAQEFAPTYTVIARLRPDVFLPAFLWMFVAEFPSPLRGRSGALADLMAAVLVAFGAGTLAAHFSTAFWPMLDQQDWRSPLVLVKLGGNLFWPVAFLSSLGALVVMLLRLITSQHQDRFRLKWFIGSLVAGLSPLFIEVLVEESVPAFESWAHQPGVERWVGLALFLPMAAVPFATAYAVIYDRIVDMRVLLRAAAQYGLARVTVASATMVPFLALGVFLFQNRTESLVTLLTGVRPVILITAIAAGLVALRLRREWLSAIDRRYFREQHDTQVLLTHLMTGNLLSQTPAEIAGRLTRELDAAFHARADLYVIDAPSGDLQQPAGAGDSLHVRGTLASLLTAESRPMDVTLTADSPLARLAEREKQWIQSGGYTLLVPLRAGSNELIGVLAMGAKRSELPYSESDRRALAALATPVSLALDNDRLRSGPVTTDGAAATECQSCSRLQERGDQHCANCGGTVAEAPAPHILRGVFKFERRLGAGGMGVVYIARDLALRRQVAIKTLPQVTGAHQERLRAEALAMASLVDPNLAVIYGIETWRGMPFLIEEYLEGGTLADRLKSGRLSIAEALELGGTLAAALSRLHDAGIVHCDIKPSNIGFTATGVPKLIDFGLVHLLRSSGETLTVTTGNTAPPTEDSGTIVTDRGLVGTPPYMSPEALNASSPQPQFDVWALAVVLFEAIAGRRPFAGRDFREVSLALSGGPPPDIRELRRDSDEPLARFFRDALARDLAARPDTAAALRDQIEVLRRLAG